MKTSVRAFAWVAGRAALAALLLAHLGAFALTPPSWKNSLYLLPQGDTTLEKVFADFRRLMSIPVDLTDAVTGPTASLGQPMAVDAFLDSLSARHGLSWFVFRDRLYVSKQSEAREVRIKVAASRMAEVRNYLTGIKLLDDRFTWVEIPSRDEVMVQGPPSYVQLVRDNAGSVKPAEPVGPPVIPTEPQQVMTFKLRYASAGDDANGRPGVVSMLSRLYGGSGPGQGIPPALRATLDRGRARMAQSLDYRNAAASAPVPELRTAQAQAARQLAGPALSDPTSAAGNFGLQGAGPGAGPGYRNAPDDAPPTFEADTRLNMVIVRDKPSRRAEYERVIAALDVVTEQIALDATVIELPIDAMRDALAAISANASVAKSASGTPALVVPRNVVERAFEQVSRARQKDGTAAIMTHGVVFSEDDPFSLDFADTRSTPQYSTTIWETLARSLVPIKIDSGDTQRNIGIKMAGTAKYIAGRGINLRLDFSEERNTPERSSKQSVGRTTSASMSVELHEDQVLVLVNSSVWGGEDMNQPRARAVLLSAQRWQTQLPSTPSTSSTPSPDAPKLPAAPKGPTP